MTLRVLITGGQGFVGKALAVVSLSNGFLVRVSLHRKSGLFSPRLEQSQVGELGAATDWSAALQGVGTVVHCAGRAHVMPEMMADSLSAFRIVNVAGTLSLARQAVASGVRRFVFLSSVGVNGSHTAPQQPFSEGSETNPDNAYALSKQEAEQGLLRIASQTGMEVVIIRPPLVYGFNAPGNFGSLMKAVQCGWPLPLGAVHNQRSFVALDNLVDFIITCMTHPQAANHTFLISDGQDVSTTELVRGLAQAAGLSVRLLPVPIWALQAGATLLGKGDVVKRLCGNLQVDISKARCHLGWMPPLTVEEGFRRAMSE